MLDVSRGNKAMKHQLKLPTALIAQHQPLDRQKLLLLQTMSPNHLFAIQSAELYPVGSQGPHGRPETVSTAHRTSLSVIIPSRNSKDRLLPRGCDLSRRRRRM